MFQGQLSLSKPLFLELDEEKNTEMVNDNRHVNEHNNVKSICPLLSMNMLSGVSNYQTARISDMYNKNLLPILTDIGSTHGFLDLQLAQIWPANCCQSLLYHLQRQMFLKQEFGVNSTPKWQNLPHRVRNVSHLYTSY